MKIDRIAIPSSHVGILAELDESQQAFKVEATYYEVRDGLAKAMEHALTDAAAHIGFRLEEPLMNACINLIATDREWMRETWRAEWCRYVSRYFNERFEQDVLRERKGS